MMRSAVAAAVIGSAAAFAPAALPTFGRSATKATTKMQLWGEGVQQGAGVKAIPFADPPASLPSDMVGYVGFDPLGFSTLFDINFLREAELKHCRVAMLAAAGSIAQDLYHFPGVDSVIGDAKMTGAHDKFIALNQAGNNQAGAMIQMAFWIGFLEIVTFPAIYETMNGGSRKPGDFMFDPLGMGKKDLGRMQLAELKNGRLAMMATGGMVHHYLVTGKGPMQFLSGIPNYKSCIQPVTVPTGLCV